MARILIIGNDEDRAEITALLTHAGHEWRPSDVLGAPALLRSWRPDAVVVDVPSAGDFDAAALVTNLREAETEGRVPIMVLIPDLPFDGGISLLRAGADKFLGKPMDPREFMAHMKAMLARYELINTTRAQANLPEHEPGRILSFYGVKGGVGTTTVAINTAIALRRLTDGRVCLVDANFQFGDLRVFMDFGMDRPGIEDVVQTGITPESILHSLSHHDTEVDVLLAPRKPESADLIEPDHVTAILAELRNRYDYVIVDLERRIDERCLRIFDADDLLFLVMNADLPSLKTTRLALETLDNLSIPHDNIHLLLNRSSAYTGIKVDDTNTLLGRRIDHFVSNEYRSAVAALNSGTPTMVAEPDSVLGRDFAALAKAIAGPEAVVPAKTGGPLTRRKTR